MTRSINDLKAPDVADVLRRSATAVMPFGSVEQHGPHLPSGTDAMAAELVAAEVADLLDGLLVPFGPYGVTPIHAGHPGTIDLRRSTFEALLTDVAGDVIAMGARRLVFVNWHEGNNASLDAVATELQAANEGVYVVTAHACYVAERLYGPEGGELTHGGGIETMAVLAYDPSLVDTASAGPPARPPEAVAIDEMRRAREIHGYITDVTEIDEHGWYGNPEWANPERAARFAATVGAEIAQRVQEIFAMREER